MIQGENKSKINKGFQNTLLLDFITLENYVENIPLLKHQIFLFTLKITRDFKHVFIGFYYTRKLCREIFRF